MKQTVSTAERERLEMACRGYQSEIDRMTGLVANIQSQLGRRAETTTAAQNGGPAGQTANEPTGKRRRISAEGRARIAAAQRKRWANVKRAGLKTMKAGG